jgi:hypothetical protein
MGKVFPTDIVQKITKLPLYSERLDECNRLAGINCEVGSIRLPPLTTSAASSGHALELAISPRLCKSSSTRNIGTSSHPS